MSKNGEPVYDKSRYMIWLIWMFHKKGDSIKERNIYYIFITAGQNQKQNESEGAPSCFGGPTQHA